MEIDFFENINLTTWFMFVDNYLFLRIAMEGVGGSQIKSKAGPLGLLLPQGVGCGRDKGKAQIFQQFGNGI